MKYVIILNSKAEQIILAEYTTLIAAKLHFDKIEYCEDAGVRQSAQIELVKYDEDNRCLDWENEELESIGQPLGQWITKQIQ